MKAIKDTGNCLVAALDPCDSVGIMDAYFPEADFFTEFERFDRHIEKLRGKGDSHKIDYVSICSPNYLHDAHIRFALRSGAHAVCEKPIVLNPWNIDALKRVEQETGRQIFTILQLRLHPEIIALRNLVQTSPADKIFTVDLTYITARGKWYQYSWKGDEKKSGGIATNIGVHFFDMLSFVFGSVKTNRLHYRSANKAGGYLEYDKANVRWFLSIDPSDIPLQVLAQGQRTYRSVVVDDKPVEFSQGFTDLHTKQYEEILQGRGFGLEESRTAIETVANIRSAEPLGMRDDCHPLLAGL